MTLPPCWHEEGQAPAAAGFPSDCAMRQAPALAGADSAWCGAPGGHCGLGPGAPAAAPAAQLWAWVSGTFPTVPVPQVREPVLLVPTQWGIPGSWQWLPEQSQAAWPQPHAEAAAPRADPRVPGSSVALRDSAGSLGTAARESESSFPGGLCGPLAGPARDCGTDWAERGAEKPAHSELGGADCAKGSARTGAPEQTCSEARTARPATPLRPLQRGSPRSQRLWPGHLPDLRRDAGRAGSPAARREQARQQSEHSPPTAAALLRGAVCPHGAIPPSCAGNSAASPGHRARHPGYSPGSPGGVAGGGADSAGSGDSILSAGKVSAASTGRRAGRPRGQRGRAHRPSRLRHTAAWHARRGAAAVQEGKDRSLAQAPPLSSEPGTPGARSAPAWVGDSPCSLSDWWGATERGERADRGPDYLRLSLPPWPFASSSTSEKCSQEEKVQPEAAPASVPTATPLGSCRSAAGTQSSRCLPGGSEEETGAAALPLGPGRGAASAQASRDTRGDDAEAAGAAALPRGLSRGAADAQASRGGLGGDAEADGAAALRLGSRRGATETQASRDEVGDDEEAAGAAALPLGACRGATDAQASRDELGDDEEAAGAAARSRGLSRGAADTQAPRCGGPDEEFVYELELFKMLAVEVATLEELDDEDAATFVKMAVEAQNEVLGCSDSEGAILRRPVAELCATLAGLRRRGWASQRRPPGGRR